MSPTKLAAAVALGRRGGRVKSEKKAAAARENGKLGGSAGRVPTSATPRTARAAGLTDRHCPHCGAWTQHRILTPHHVWQCKACQGVSARTKPETVRACACGAPLPCAVHAVSA